MPLIFAFPRGLCCVGKPNVHETGNPLKSAMGVTLPKLESLLLALKENDDLIVCLPSVAQAAVVLKDSDWVFEVGVHSLDNIAANLPRYLQVPSSFSANY